MIADRTGAEESLRRAFIDAAATVREDELTHDVPARPQGRLAATGRRRLLIPAAAAAAVLAVSIVAVTVPGVVRGRSPGPGPTTAVVPGPIAYVITGRDGSLGFSDKIVRISLATGRVAAHATSLPAGQATAAITPNGAIICILTDNFRRAHLTTINARTGAAAPPIAVPADNDLPLSVAITPDGRGAYVFEPAYPATAGSVVPVNLVTESAGRKISIAGAEQMVMTPNGSTVYVLAQQAASRQGPQYYGPRQVVPIDTATNTALPPIKVAAGGLADSIAVSPDGKTVYVATSWVNHVSAVTPISTASNAAMAPIPIRLAAYSGGILAMAPDGNTAYLYGDSQYVFPIDLRTNKMLTPIRLPADYACMIRKGACSGTWAWSFQIAPDSRTAYLYGPPDADVIPIDLATGTAQAPLVVARPPYAQVASDASPFGIGFGSGYLYVPVVSVIAPSHDVQFHGGLSEVQLATGQVRTIDVGDWPQEVIVAP
jgi:DNA-binding beta-propeller fold protein YncE